MFCKLRHKRYSNYRVSDCIFPSSYLVAFLLHHPQEICTGKKDLGGQGLNKGREGAENKSKTEERAGGKKGMLA